MGSCLGGFCHGFKLPFGGSGLASWGAGSSWGGLGLGPGGSRDWGGPGGVAFVPKPPNKSIMLVLIADETAEKTKKSWLEVLGLVLCFL